MGSEQQPDLGLVAKLASRGLFAPRSLSPDEIRAVCAIALMHVPDHWQVAMVAQRPQYQQIDIALALVRCATMQLRGADRSATTSQILGHVRRAPRRCRVRRLIFLSPETLSRCSARSGQTTEILDEQVPRLSGSFPHRR